MAQLRLSVVAIGGNHQALHFIPLVLKLAERGHVVPEIFVATQGQRDAMAVQADNDALAAAQAELDAAYARWQALEAG